MPGKKIAYTMGLLLALVFIFIAYNQRDFLWENPLALTREFEQPSFVSTSTDGITLVIDNSKTRVSVLKNHEITATISGGKLIGGFYYAEYAATDGEYIYISDMKYASVGTGIETERIMRYTLDGRYIDTVFERAYEHAEMPLQYGNIRSVQAYDGTLTFLLKSGLTLDLYSIVQGTPSYIRSTVHNGASAIRHAYYNAAGDSICAMTMRGELYVENGDALSPINSWATVPDRVPWEIASDSAGRLYLTDLLSQSVVRLPHYLPVFEADMILYRMTINEDDVISVTDNTSIFQVWTDGTVIYASDTAPYGWLYLGLRLIVWLLALIVGITALILALRFVAWLIRGSRSNESKILFLVIISTALTSSIVAASILSTDADRLDQKNRLSLTQIAMTISDSSGNTFGDDLEAIEMLGDHGKEKYRHIRSYLNPPCVSAAEHGSYMYFLLYKFTDDMLYAVMDYEDSIYTTYPMFEIEGSGYDEVARGEIPYLFESSSDSYGVWTYAVAPVFNSSGAIIGLVEYGLNLYGETLQNRQQIWDIVISTAVLLVLFLLVFSEATVVAECSPKFRQRRLRAIENIPELVRPLAFLAFFADSTCVAFLPQLAARIFDSSGLLFSESLGAALPISVKMFFVAITSVAGGSLLDKFGMKRVLLCGVLLQMSGLVVTALAIISNGYIMLLVGKCIMGCGLGIIAVSCNTLPAASRDISERNKLFSGVNVGLTAGVVVGVAVGSYAAYAVGYALTFVFSAVILIPAVLLSLLCAPKSMPATITSEDADAQHPGISAARFLTNKSVFSFLFFLLFPFLSILSFKDYVFPLFASGIGYSEVSIGQVLLFSGAIAIFIAPAISAYSLEKLGARTTNLLACAACVAGLFIFAISPLLETSIFLVYVLNIFCCFGLVSQGIYFSSLRASQSFGLGKSMGVFSLVDNLSQTAGPLLFGCLMIFGYRTAALVISLASFALLLLYIVANLRGKSDDGKEP